MMRKPHLHILQRRELMSHIAFVESPTVYREFRITKSDEIVPSVDLIFTQTYTDTSILEQFETCDVPYIVHLQGDVWYEMKEIYHAESVLRRISEVLLRAKLVVCISDFLRQIAHRVGRNANTHAIEFAGNLDGGLASPLATADRITGSFIFHDVGDRIHDLRRFFSCDGRPRHRVPAADRWRLNPSPSVLCALLQQYADPCPE